MARVIQVFGTQGCTETRKALRFFKERRIDHHFVDLRQRGMSKGELNRFAQQCGAPALIDEESKRFRNRGLHAAHLTERKIFDLVERDPRLLATPLVRIDGKVWIGYDPERWTHWLQEGG